MVSSKKSTSVSVSEETIEKIRLIQEKWQTQQRITGLKVTQRAVVETLVDEEFQKIDSEEK